MDLDQREAEIDAFNVPSDAIRQFPSRRSRVAQSPSAPVLPTVKPKNKGQQLLRLSASSQDLVASAYEKEVKSLRPRDRTPTGYQIIARRRQAERPLKLTKLPKVPEASPPPAQPPSPSPTRRRSATKEDMSADVSAYNQAVEAGAVEVVSLKDGPPLQKRDEKPKPRRRGSVYDLSPENIPRRRVILHRAAMFASMAPGEADSRASSSQTSAHSRLSWRGARRKTMEINEKELARQQVMDAMAEAQSKIEIARQRFGMKSRGGVGRRSRLDEAEEAATEAITTSPVLDPSLYEMRSLVRASQMDFHGALEDASRARELYSDQPDNALRITTMKRGLCGHHSLSC